jgi:DNA-binding NarL/FixJ family response regulator
MAETEPIRVAILDDHLLFAQGLAFILGPDRNEEVVVVGTAERASEAEDLVRRCRPDLLVVDLAMPEPGGLGAISVVRRRYPQVRILALSGTDSLGLILDALAAGADGFIPKTADPAVIMAPLRAVATGWNVLPRAVLDRLLESTDRAAGTILEKLSDDERALWRMVADGLETAEIGERLHVSESTAKRLMGALFRHIGADNRVQAAALAGRAGLLDAGK